MAASGALGPFLSTMAEIRAQRLKEQELKDAGMAAMGAALGSGITSLGSSIGNAVQAGQANEMANVSMNKMNPPMAMPVSGKMPTQALPGQTSFAAQPANMGGPATGGTKQLEINKTMGMYSGNTQDQLIKDTNARIALERFNMAKRSEERAKSVAKSKAAEDSYNKLSEQNKALIQSAESYQKTAPVLYEKLITATDPDVYNGYANSLRSQNAMAQKNNLQNYGVQIMDVPPFVPPEDKKLLQSLQSAEQAAKAPGMTMSQLSQDPTVAAAQQGISGKATPMSTYQAPQAPAQAPSADFAAPAQGHGSTPGSRHQDPLTKKWYVWDGSKFIPE